VHRSRVRRVRLRSRDPSGGPRVAQREYRKTKASDGYQEGDGDGQRAPFSSKIGTHHPSKLTDDL
jgi:hypothetical protein